jgi:hypothetical protein
MLWFNIIMPEFEPMEVLPETFEGAMSLRKPGEKGKMPVPPRTRN